MKLLTFRPEWRCPGFWNAALETALWSSIFTLHNSHFKDSYFVSQKAFSFLSFIFLSAYPWNELTLKFKSQAVLFLPLMLLERWKVGAGFQTFGLKMNILPEGGIQRVGAKASSTCRIRSQTKEPYPARCFCCWKYQEVWLHISCPVLSSQSLHLTERESHRLWIKLLLRMLSI